MHDQLLDGRRRFNPVLQQGLRVSADQRADDDTGDAGQQQGERDTELQASTPVIRCGVDGGYSGSLARAPVARVCSRLIVSAHPRHASVMLWP